MDYYQKYQKYKLKYLQLKQRGGTTPTEIDIDTGASIQTIGQCVKELIETSFKIYKKILDESSEDVPTTIICGGQSPAYYCLAMMNFPIFDSNKANIIILPHSKGGEESDDQIKENALYCERLKGKGIELKGNVVIIDGVYSGVGILALESALKSCYKDIKTIKRIAINYKTGIARIKVDAEFGVFCHPKFSDIFPRLTVQYYPKDFNDESKFITEFQKIDSNPIAQMIIDLAKNYNEDTNIENSDWYKKNNIETDKIKEDREYFKEHKDNPAFVRMIANGFNPYK